MRWESIAGASMMAGSQVACAQWEAVRLHPPGSPYSHVYAVGPTGQYGDASDGTAPVAAHWTGSPGAFSSWGHGLVYGVSVDGQQQVGVSGRGAALWSGSPGSLVSLHDPAWYASSALATGGSEQVGWYIPSSPSEGERAVIWRGSASSAVSLHPSNAFQSVATGAVPGLQGGYVRYNAPNMLAHAVLWQGTPESLIDLTPVNSEAQVLGMAPGQQVGWVDQPGSLRHAALWSGSAASLVDLHPAGAGVSQLNGTCGSAQVGYANLVVGGITAGIWFGTPESFVPLRPYLPAGYGSSTATSVAFDGQRYYVGGYALPGGSNWPEAFLWIGVPAPGTLAALTVLPLLALRPRRGRAAARA